MKAQNILVIGGLTKETYDTVRHIRNNLRTEDHGHKVALELARQGANVTLVTTKTQLSKPNEVNVIDSKKDGTKIVSTSDLKDAVVEQLISNWFDSIVNLAVTPSIRPAEIKNQKVKRDKKSGDAETIQVTGNIDLLDHLAKTTETPQLVGYDRKQNLKTVKGDNDLEDLITRTNTSERVVIGEVITSRTLNSQPLAGKRILITSGRTEEQITQSGDVITNFASGRQGHAIAQALADMGANVILITGPSYLPDPNDDRIQTIHIKSSTELRDTSLLQLPVDAAVCVSAVADFGSKTKPDLKLFENEVAQLTLDQMPDTLQTLGTHESKRPQAVIGFAAETEKLHEYAKSKLTSKGADVIVANEAGVAMVKRNSQNNKVFFVTQETVKPLNEMSKYDIGLEIGAQIVSLLANRQKAL